MSPCNKTTMALVAVSLLSLGSPIVLAQGLQEKGKSEGLVLAFVTDPPNTFLDETGAARGSLNDILVGALKPMGIKVRPLLVEWSTIVPGVKSGRYDVGQGMYITPARCAEVSFSNPVSKSSTAIQVLKGNPKNIKSYDDIKTAPTLMIGVLAGAAESKFVAKAGISNKQIVPLPDNTALLQALLSGRIDAITLSLGTINELVKASSGATERVTDFVVPPYAESYVAYIVAKKNAEFLDGLNAGIAQVLKSDEYAKMVNDGLIEPGADGVTGQEICNRVSVN